MRHEIDTSEWIEFKAGNDLGFKCFHGTRLNKAARIDGETPFVTAGFDNHGIAQYIGNDRPTYHKAITIDMFGNCFFQPDDCAGDDNVYFFVNNDVSDVCKMFIAACIHSVTSERYAYVEQFRQPDADALAVKLPATPSGEPDWDYMDAYMSKVLAEEQAYADALSKHDFAKHEIDTSRWKEFKVGELFDTFKPPVLHDRQVTPSENGLPYVVRTKFNNGIKDLVIAGKEVEPSPAGVITWGAENASFFYQEKPFYSGRDIYYLDTRGLNMNTCHFLAAALSTVVSKYPYNYGLFPDLLKGETIRLPVTSSGKPDWDYMDAYMSKIMGEEKSVADELTA